MGLPPDRVTTPLKDGDLWREGVCTVRPHLRIVLVTEFALVRTPRGLLSVVYACADCIARADVTERHVDERGNTVMPLIPPPPPPEPDAA